MTNYMTTIFTTNHKEVEQQQPLLSPKAKTTSPPAATNTTTNGNYNVGLLIKNHYILPWFGAIFVWMGLFAVPLTMTMSFSPFHYKKIFEPAWYEVADDDNTNTTNWPKPLGLCLGISAVFVGQVFVWIFFYLFRHGYLGSSSTSTSLRNSSDNKQEQSPPMPMPMLSIQTKGAPIYEFWEGLRTHISQPEGFILLAGYLSVTWMFNLMPKSYYQFDNDNDNDDSSPGGNGGTIQWELVLLCLIIQDGIQYVMHRLEHHDLSKTFYQYSHKPHHKFTNPRLFDAFNGSLADTVFMIVIPLYITANIVRTANVWTYMSFGSCYASWLTLIHAEYVFIWDGIFRKVGLGTPADHHVHHKFFKYNYGHLFMWWDQLMKTYKDPSEFAPKAFHDGV